GATLGDGNVYNGTIVATTSMKVLDYATLRGRAGWAFGNWLPYATFGLAVGRGETSRVTSVFGTPTGAGTAFVSTDTIHTSPTLWGHSAGVGVDVLLTPAAFLRAEYEFVRFFTVSTIRTNVSTARVGAGIRF